MKARWRERWQRLQDERRESTRRCSWAATCASSSSATTAPSSSSSEKEAEEEEEEEEEEEGRNKEREAMFQSRKDRIATGEAAAAAEAGGKSRWHSVLAPSASVRQSLMASSSSSSSSLSGRPPSMPAPATIEKLFAVVLEGSAGELEALLEGG